MVLYMAIKALAIAGMILGSLNFNWAYPLHLRYSGLGERLTMLGKKCVDSSGNLGICIFKWDCISQNGVMLSTCVDGFLFGACCALNSSMQGKIVTQTADETSPKVSVHSSNFDHLEKELRETARKNISASVKSNDQNDFDSLLNGANVSLSNSRHSLHNSSHEETMGNAILDKHVFNYIPQLQRNGSDITYSFNSSTDEVTTSSENLFRLQTTLTQRNENTFTSNDLSEIIRNVSSLQSYANNQHHNLITNESNSGTHNNHNEFRIKMTEYPRFPTSLFLLDAQEDQYHTLNETKKFPMRLASLQLSEGFLSSGSNQKEKEIKHSAETKAVVSGTNNGVTKLYKGNSSTISFTKQIENIAMKENLVPTLNNYTSLFPSSFQAVVNQLTSKETASEKIALSTTPSDFKLSSLKAEDIKIYESLTEVNSEDSVSKDATAIHQTGNRNNKSSLIVSNTGAGKRKPSQVQMDDTDMTHLDDLWMNVNEISNTIQKPNESSYQKSSMSTILVTEPVNGSTDSFQSINSTIYSSAISEEGNTRTKHNSNIDYGYSSVPTNILVRNIENTSDSFVTVSDKLADSPAYSYSPNSVTRSEPEKITQDSKMELDKMNDETPNEYEHKLAANKIMKIHFSEKLSELITIVPISHGINKHHFPELNNEGPSTKEQISDNSIIFNENIATMQPIMFKSPMYKGDSSRIGENVNANTSPLTHLSFSTDYSNSISPKTEWTLQTKTRPDNENNVVTSFTVSSLNTEQNTNENNLHLDEQFVTAFLELETQNILAEKMTEINSQKLGIYTVRPNFTTMDPSLATATTQADGVQVSSTDSSGNVQNEVSPNYSLDTTNSTLSPFTFEESTFQVDSSALQSDSSVNVVAKNYSQTSQDFETLIRNNGWDYKKDCGVRPMQPVGRIVGGQNTYLGKWPWQALVKEATWLGLFVKNKCGGVLISSKYVLTAAHCQPGFLASLLVVLGTHDLSNFKESANPVIRNVKRMVVHRHYNPLTFENDLAILEMDPELEFLPSVLPICLPHRDEDFTGEMAFVTGWGKLTHGGDVPNILQEVQVPIVTNQDCQKMFYQAGHHKAIQTNFVCAGYRNGGQDSCEGDSGGPLMVQRKDKRWVLVGTVSHGIGCADPNLPGVYMRMSSYRTWIDSIMKEN